MNYEFSFDKKAIVVMAICFVLAALLIFTAGLLVGLKRNTANRPVAPSVVVPVKNAPVESSMREKGAPAVGNNANGPQVTSNTNNPSAAAGPSNGNGDTSAAKKTADAETDSTLIPITAQKRQELRKYTLQYGAFRETQNAEQLLKTLGSNGIKATVSPLRNSMGQVWFAVRSGDYASLEEASQTAINVRRSLNLSVLVRPAGAL